MTTFKIFKDSLQGLKLHIIKHDCFCYSYTIYLNTEKKITRNDKGKIAVVAFGKCRLRQIMQWEMQTKHTKQLELSSKKRKQENFQNNEQAERIT